MIGGQIDVAFVVTRTHTHTAQDNIFSIALPSFDCTNGSLSMVIDLGPLKTAALFSFGSIFHR